jgi:hypothetical protein
MLHFSLDCSCNMISKIIKMKCNRRHTISPDSAEWAYANSMTKRLIKYCAMKCSSCGKISTIENEHGLKKIINIDRLDLIVCLILSKTLLSNASQDLVRKFCQNINNSSPVQNPAQFWCIVFWNEVASTFANWKRCTLFRRESVEDPSPIPKLEFKNVH